MSRFEMILAVVTLCGSAAIAATIRPGGDPPHGDVIFADPFDFYNQWAWDNRDNPSYTRGTMWQDGPIPPGVTTGAGYPTKAPNSGCGTVAQNNPAPHEMLRAHWFSSDCPVINVPGGSTADRASIEANIDQKCGVSGQIAVNTGQYALNNSTWGTGGSVTYMGQFTNYFGDRIQAIADARGEGRKNGVNGTNEHPLVVVFYLGDGSRSGSDFYGDQFDNSYVELSMIGGITNRNDTDAMAPTDYIWMGDHTKSLPDMDACPPGPYPVICQQVRENNNNGTAANDAYYLQYVNDHCPALNTTKTWRSIAVGFLAISDTDPCGVHYPIDLAQPHGDRHKPQALHLAVFDGNVWRQLAAGRFHGLDKSVAWPPPFPWDPGMAVGEPNSSDDFTLTGGTVRVVLKITTDWIMIYATTSLGGANFAEHGAAIPRVYRDAFDAIRWGAGPGCELDSTTGACKAGTSPNCLTYSRITAEVPVGFDRTILDSPSVLYGELQYVDLFHGRCCKPDGSCEVVDDLTCTNQGGSFMGINTTCDGTPCAGACCQPRGVCTQTAVNACPGNFQGYGTLCTTQGRCQCPVPFADYDGDHDVDMDDFAGLQACLTDGTPAITTACRCFDKNADGQIDLTDVESFEDCATGKDITWASTPLCPD